VAILHDGYLQRMRVGATSALAADRLARPDARMAGVIGAGWQAGAQVLGLREVRELEEIRVYAPRRDRLEAFCEEYDATPVSSAREAIDGADVVALATNAQEPVLDGSWLAPGAHVGSVHRHEVDDVTFERAGLIVVRTTDDPTFHYADGHRPRDADHRRVEGPNVVELSDVLAGRAGRRSPDEITLFTGGGGLGIQFAAVAHAVYERAREAGLGRELPTEWFTQTDKP
jgi:alanine dehydrogenase